MYDIELKKRSTLRAACLVFFSFFFLIIVLNWEEIRVYFHRFHMHRTVFFFTYAFENCMNETFFLPLLVILTVILSLIWHELKVDSDSFKLLAPSTIFCQLFVDKTDAAKICLFKRRRIKLLFRPLYRIPAKYILFWWTQNYKMTV